MLDKTYSRYRLCWTKPIPGIDYVEQNIIWDLDVKICKIGCFASNKIITECFRLTKSVFPWCLFLPAIILFMLFLATVKNIYIRLFEKIYFGESCEPYTTYFLKFRPCYFNNEGQKR